MPDPAALPAAPDTDPVGAVDPVSTHRALVRALARPAAWPVPLAAGATFELVETHISSLLLAGDGVIKLKKPVALPFVDFSTVERRHHFCREELRLNRRTAPDLYRAVLPVHGPADAPRLGEPAPEGGVDGPPAAAVDPPVDWAVWMRRFDDGGLFDRLAADGRLTAAHVDALADEIARFHAAEPPSPASLGSPEGLVATVEDNLRELRALASDPTAGGGDLDARLAGLQAWSGTRAAMLQPLLAARRARGAVIEGHGDMHLGNIVWDRGRACLFDALEFSPELRHGDRLADLAFPFMDLHDHALPRLAWRLLSRVLDASGDHDGLPLLRWLAAHRALVRAKVALLSASLAPAAGPKADRRATARRRVALARWLADAGPAPLVLTCGLSGSGKSTVALQLAEALGAVRVRSDVERKRLHGLAPTARVGDPVRLYGPDSTRRTYDRLLAIARDTLAGGVGVVLDAAFLRRDERRQAQSLAAALGLPFAVVVCQAPLPVLAARVGRRQAADDDPSDAGLDVLARQPGVFEPPGDDEDAHVLDTSGPLTEVARAVDTWAAAFAARHGHDPASAST